MATLVRKRGRVVHTVLYTPCRRCCKVIVLYNFYEQRLIVAGLGGTIQGFRLARMQPHLVLASLAQVHSKINTTRGILLVNWYFGPISSS